MKNINWWKVASVAMMAASAILSFGHDLIEEQRSEEEMQDMVREEVQRQLAEKKTVNAKNTVSLMEEISKLTNKGD